MTSEHSGPGFSWYDLLGVSRDATAEEIKAAWRRATDTFEPGSGTGQFRLFNEAADVLLDPQRRAEYDASLAEQTPEPGVHAEEPAAEPSAAEPAADSAAPDVADAGAEAPPPPSSRSFRVPSAWALAVCLPVLLVSLVLVIGQIWGVQVGPLALDDAGTRSAARDWDAATEAEAAASRALTSVLAYDYRHLDADRERATGFLTDSYAKEFSKSFGLLTAGKDGKPGPAVKTKTVVTAEVLGTGVADASKDRVRVIAFVNQSATKAGADKPTTFQNRLVATMVRRGDAWLIADVKAY